MSKIAFIISLDLIRIKIEKLLTTFGMTDFQMLSPQMISIASKNFPYTDVSLIILDVDTKDFQVQEVIARLKSGEKSAHIPILALGNRADKVYSNGFKALGCADYITKPIDDMSFASRVLQLIRDHSVQEDVLPEKVYSDVKLQWHEAFEVGIEVIDTEHKAIIEHFERLYQLMKKGQGHDYYHELLAFLKEYIDTHFAHEEALQEEIGYRDIDAHKSRHALFSDTIMRFVSEKPDNPSHSDLIRLNLYIKDWLLQHILIEDKKIGAFYRSKRPIH